MQNRLVHACFPYIGTPFVTTWRVAEIESTIPLVNRSPWVKMEYTIPSEELPHVIKELVALYIDYKEKYLYERLLPFTFRPVNADRCGYLCPAKGRKTTFVDVPYDLNVS